MRRLVVFLIFGLTLAPPATAREGRVTTAPPARDAALRGSVGLSPPAAPEAPPLLLPLPAQPTSISRSPASGRHCRLTCSQQYYFCLAGEDDRCPQYWSRCVSGCGS